MVDDLLTVLEDDRSLVLVRAASIPDPGALCAALVAGGIRAVELTFTTPNVGELLRAAVAADTGAIVGAGTVTTVARAREAIDAGARFLVTPGVSDEVAAVARDADVPVIMGALTPTEVMRAVDLGSTAVKLFPAAALGTAYLAQLRGPFPDVPIVVSGGVTTETANDWITAGALAATAGSGVVAADDVAASRWDAIGTRARAFRQAATGG